MHNPNKYWCDGCSPDNCVGCGPTTRMVTQPTERLENTLDVIEYWQHHLEESKNPALLEFLKVIRYAAEGYTDYELLGVPSQLLTHVPANTPERPSDGVPPADPRLTKPRL